MTRQITWVGSTAMGSCKEADFRVWSRGYAVGPDRITYLDDEIGQHLARNQDRLAQTAAQMNGCFAAVLIGPPGAWVVTDRIGSVPIYLGPHAASGGMALSDTPWPIIEGLAPAPRITRPALVDMLTAGYVTGNETLIEGVTTAAPAAITTIAGGAARTQRYWRYGYFPEAMSADEAADQLTQVLSEVIARSVAILDRMRGRAVLTLSGGLDSRLLAGLLAGTTARTPAAVSYGAPDDPEVMVAAEVAAALGYDFRSVPLDGSYFNPDFLARSVDEVGMTTRFTSGTGARHLACEAGDVLVPGHTGDFVSGGHLPPHAALVGNRAQLHRFLDLRHFRYPGSDRILRQVLPGGTESRFESLARTTADFDFSQDMFGLIDRWNVENRQRRLILMELRAYERVAPWILPFYDHALIDFFARLPHALRLGQRLYTQVALERVFTGRAAALATIRRVGKPLRVDEATALRLERFARLPKVLRTPVLAGWPLAREALAWRRGQKVATGGPDPIRHWFASDAGVRRFLTERIQAISVSGVDGEALLALANSGTAPEAFFHRVLTAAITAQEVQDTATRRWQAARAAR